MVLAAPGHQVISFPHIIRLVSTRDNPNEGGVVCKLEEFDGRTTGGVAVGVYSRGEEQGRKNAALRRSGADGPGVRDLCTQLNTLLPVRQEVCDPPAGGIHPIQFESVD